MKESPISDETLQKQLLDIRWDVPVGVDDSVDVVTVEQAKEIAEAYGRKKYQEGELNGRIAGAKAYKDTLQSRMASEYENNVTIKEMEGWFNTWKEGQSQLERKEQ